MSSQAFGGWLVELLFWGPSSLWQNEGEMSSKRLVKIYNLSRQVMLADNAEIPKSYLGRMQGLLGRAHLAQGEGMLLTSCRWIHTFFMKFAIDVLFLNRDLVVIAAASNLRPYRFSRICWRACMVLELPAGIVTRTSTQPGDQLEIRSVADDKAISC